MQTTLQELLHAINILGDDYDVHVDGIDACAVCPPVKMTPAGREHFKRALNAKVTALYTDDNHRDTYVSDDDESVDEEAWNLVTSLAGYCGESEFAKWFEGDDAEIL